MDKRYQIFVSSTYEDLKEERKAVIEAILQMKHIPAGMELFSASNDEQFEYIKEIIDNCDYYILIIAGRYGSVNSKTGISYTEQEYKYAVEKNIPVLVFLHNDRDNIPPEKKDDNFSKLEQFIEEVSKNRLCKFWSNISELQAYTIISLNEQFSKNPQAGWIRGNGYNNAELLEQINQLRMDKENIQKENVELKTKINEYSLDVKDLAMGDENFEIKGRKSYYGDHIDFTKKLTWDTIFSLVAPFLISPQGYNTFYSNIKRVIAEHTGILIYTIYEDCVQTIKIHLFTAGLINVYSSQTVNGGVAEFIQLTEKGQRYLKQIKSVKTQKEILSPEN